VVVLAQNPRRAWVVDDGRLPYPVVRHPRFVSTWQFVRWYRYWLLKLHRRFPFDVLHCHCVHPCGYLGALCKDQLHAPLVITSHGGDVREGNACLRKPGSHERFTLALKNADALVSISRLTTDCFRRLYPPGKIVEIPNGVELGPFPGVVRPANLDPRVQPGQYVLFLGRLHWRKGVDVLLDAWAAVPAEDRSQKMLVVAGDGEERARLVARAHDLGISSQVHFAGIVLGADKTWLLQNARGLCLPSRNWEAFGLVVLEGFAAGKPMIGTRLPGFEDLISPGSTGWLVPPESPAELARAVRELLVDDERLRHMSTAVRHKAESYGWQAIAARHVELYEQLLGRSQMRQAA
jgi:glycosyltransferase involved in cell wall biosynthesis